MKGFIPDIISCFSRPIDPQWMLNQSYSILVVGNIRKSIKDLSILLICQMLLRFSALVSVDDLGSSNLQSGFNWNNGLILSVSCNQILGLPSLNCWSNLLAAYFPAGTPSLQYVYGILFKIQHLFLLALEHIFKKYFVKIKFYPSCYCFTVILLSLNNSMQ